MPAGRYVGMTLSERLFDAGLLDIFDRAAVARDREKMQKLLEEVDLAPEEARQTVDSILRDPAKFGF
jgi:hypothetical protein